MDFSEKKILVVGLGKSGLSASRWLVKQGAHVVLGDVKGEEELDPESLHEAVNLGVRLETGGHRKETFVHSDMIIVSPGVPLDIAPLREAREKGVPVIGEIEFAARWIDVPMVAVTGTNGKSTAVSLLGEMARASGANPFVGGNIGTPLMDYVAGDRKEDYALVEVSSFQLDTIERFRPDIAVLLNISPDHLDRYADYEAYVQSKMRIFKNQGEGNYAIVNDDDPRLAGFRHPGGATVLRYGLEKKDSRNAFLKGGMLAAGLPGAKACEFDLATFSLPGRHNLENLMGVVLAGLCLGLKPESIADGITRFKGLPHRMEPVGTVRGIAFYDDSKATNVDAAARSIRSFDHPVILIAGGCHKGGDYGPLVSAAEGRVKKAVLMGEARDLIGQSFQGAIPFVTAQDMEDAVSKAFRSAESGDVVLLAPACSSFDMFSDYGHRGRVFREKVERLAHEG